MCELLVLLNKDGDSQQVAKNVVYAFQNGDTLIVKDILGTPTEVSSAMIAKLNIANETLTLVAHPLIGKFLNFFALLTDESNISDIEQAWGQLKKTGDELILKKQ